MDGSEILKKLQQSEGYNPENNKEKSFIEDLRQDGFVYVDRGTKKFKMTKNVEIEENSDEVILNMVPTLYSLELFLMQDNFAREFEVKPRHLGTLINLLTNFKTSDVKGVLGEHKLGKEYTGVITGYAKTDNIEGYKLELPAEILDIKKVGRGTDGVIVVSKKKGVKDKELFGGEFKNLRRTTVKLKLGVSCDFGVIYSLEELENLKKTKVINKASFYA